MGGALTDADVEETIGSIIYRFSLISYARSLILQRIGCSTLAVTSSPLAYQRTPRPPLPGPDWVRVRMHLMGICGSDIGMLRATLSPQLSPFSSFPAVMGHEGVGEIVEVGPASAFSIGQRVVGDPFLGCVVRALTPCQPCAAGVPALCEHTTEGRFAPGMLLGTCRDLPGTWSEETLYHDSQLHLVPDGMADDQAVLVEPLAVAVHAVLSTPPRPGDHVLVVGDGTIGLLTVAALRLLGFDQPVDLVAHHPERADQARLLGATDVVLAQDGLSALASRLGARVVRALDRSEVMIGGADVVYDAVGTRTGLDLALCATRARGRLCLVGSPGNLAHLDLTAVWSRDVEVRGTLAYGHEPAYGGLHTFDLVIRLLQDGRLFPIQRLVSHRFPLSEVAQALATVAGKGAGRPVKVVFEGVQGGTSA